MKNLYVDLSVIQTVPSSNINRDDTGSPKTALYGGVTRSRVSSQSWKRATRSAFRTAGESTGTRTKKGVQLLATKLSELDPSLDADAALAKATEVFATAGIKIDKKTAETGALLLVSPGQIEKLAQYALNNTDFDKKELKKVLQGDHSLDLALFGRMVADAPELNVDASAQVAHAISTHEVVPEFDYYTALDDQKTDDTNGAAMLGTIEFNSATLYRYANINLTELSRNLGAADAIHGVTTFIKSFLLSTPTGKQNTFANKTTPSYVMLTVRTDTPVNLVSAFEEPVVSKAGYVAKSIEKLETEYRKALDFVEHPVINLVLGHPISQVGQPVANVAELLNQVTETLTKAVQHADTND